MPSFLHTLWASSSVAWGFAACRLNEKSKSWSVNRNRAEPSETQLSRMRWYMCTATLSAHEQHSVVTYSDVAGEGDGVGGDAPDVQVVHVFHAGQRLEFGHHDLPVNLPKKEGCEMYKSVVHTETHSIQTCRNLKIAHSATNDDKSTTETYIRGGTLKENQADAADQRQRGIERDDGEEHRAHGVDDLPVGLPPQDRACDGHADALDEVGEHVQVGGLQVHIRRGGVAAVVVVVVLLGELRGAVAVCVAVAMVVSVVVRLQIVLVGAVAVGAVVVAVAVVPGLSFFLVAAVVVVVAAALRRLLSLFVTQQGSLLVVAVSMTVIVAVGGGLGFLGAAALTVVAVVVRVTGQLLALRLALRRVAMTAARMTVLVRVGGVESSAVILMEDVTQAQVNNDTKQRHSEHQKTINLLGGSLKPRQTTEERSIQQDSSDNPQRQHTSECSKDFRTSHTERESLCTRCFRSNRGNQCDRKSSDVS